MWEFYLNDYYSYLKLERSLSENSISAYLNDIKKLRDFIKFKKIDLEPNDIDIVIINDFLEKGFKAYISSNIRVSYVCRSSFRNILRLFNTYGYCRANTILVSRKLFISKRHFFVFITLVLCFLTLYQLSIYYIIILPLIFIIYNFCGEIILHKKKINLLVPICSTLCQFSWILGFMFGVLSIFKIRESKSNFIS